MDINSLIDKLNNNIEQFNELKCQYNEFIEFHNSNTSSSSCCFSNDDLEITEIQIINNVILNDKFENKIIGVYENIDSSSNCTSLVVVKNNSLIVVKAAVKNSVRISAKSVFLSVTLSLLNFFI